MLRWNYVSDRARVFYTAVFVYNAGRWHLAFTLHRSSDFEFIVAIRTERSAGDSSTRSRAEKPRSSQIPPKGNANLPIGASRVYFMCRYNNYAEWGLKRRDENCSHPFRISRTGYIKRRICIWITRGDAPRSYEKVRANRAVTVSSLYVFQR